MKNKKIAVFLALVLGMSAIIDSIPSSGVSICQASSISESSLHCSLNDVTQLYRGVAFSEDSTDLFETATLILQTDNKDFDTQSADKVLSISNNLYALSFSDSRRAKAAYLKYRQMTGIDFVEPDAIVSTNTEKEKSTEKVTEAHASTENPTGAEQIAEQNVKKATLKVALIDTGVDIDNDSVSTYLATTENVTDQNGHGTQIAGLLADSFSKAGITAKQVQLLPIKVADLNGKCTMLQLYLGIESAIQSGADILNISMGTKDIAGSALLGQAVDDAYCKGVIIVTSAGNNQDDVLQYAPANLDKVITVGSVNEKKEMSGFSNHGNSIDCVSYGENITVTGLNEKKETVNGTSFSAALVTGDILKQMIVGTILTPDDAAVYVQNVAEDLGTVGWDENYGYGLIGSYTYPAEEKESERESETEKPNGNEVTPTDDSTQPVTNYADSGNLTQAQQKEMQACLAYGDILNDINTVAATQNVYAATGLISIAKTKAAQLQESIKTGYITARYFTGQGYVCPVTYQNIGNQPVDVAGKAMEDSLYTYAKSGSGEDLTAFYGKLDEFYNVLNANRNLNVQAESAELTNLTSTAAASAADQLNAQATLGTTDTAVSIEAYEVGFSDTEAINQWQNLESNKLLESLNRYNAAQLKKFVTSLSDNDQQLLAASLGQHYQDIMARVYDAEVQTESADQTTYYVADEASNRLYAQTGSYGSDTVTVNSTMTLQPVASILLTSPVTVNNYMVVSKGMDVAIDSTNAANGYNLGSNFDYTKTAGSDTSTFDGKTYYLNYTFSMIYIQSGATLSIQGKAFLDGKNRPHNGFLVFMQNNSRLKLKDSAVLRNNNFISYSGQKNGGYGSAICVSSGSTFNMTGGSIIKNKNCERDTGILTQGGAAIGNQGGTVAISGGTISGNTSALGAIWNCAGTLNLSGGTITGNASDSSLGGNIHLSKEGATASIANISGGTICDSVAGNGIFVSNGCTCNIRDKDVYIYGNKEAGISNGGTLNITAGVKIGFTGYTDITSYSVDQNGSTGILNTGTLTISGAARVYGGSVPALINYERCTVNAGADAIFLGINAECVCNNMGYLDVAGHDANGKMSLGIYSSSSIYGISNNSVNSKGQLIFGGNIDGSYNVTTTGRQASSPTNHAFKYCLWSNSTKYINDTTYPYAVYIFGAAVIHNGETGIMVDAGSTYMCSADIRNNTKDGVCNDTGATTTVVSNQMNIYSNGKNGITNNGTLMVTGTGTNISSNGNAGINNSGTAALHSGTITANNRGIQNSGNLTMSGGSITANRSATTGAGIYNDDTGSIAINAGSISNNAALTSGGGIYNRGSINMAGGTISGNRADTYGGGLMNKAGAIFALSGGSILSNTGNVGGIFNSGTVNMTNGSISGNANHGIYQSGTFNMSGAAAVDTNNDVCLAYGNVITVNGALTTAGTVANITPLNQTGSAFAKIIGEDNYQSGGLGVSVVRTSYPYGKASSALYYNSNAARFVLSNGGILRPGDYMDDGVIASELAKETIRSTIADTDIAISTTYSITYDKNLDNVPVTMPVNQNKYWCEDVKLIMGMPVITDATKAAQFEFLHWNDKADDKGTTYANGQMYKGNSNTTIYAQWQNNINIAYIGNEQQKGNDYSDQNVSQSKDYTFGSNQDASGGKHFDKTAIKTYTDAETGKKVEQEVGCTVVGWRLGKTDKAKSYQLNTKERCSDIYNIAQISYGAVTYGLPNNDYGSHDPLLTQLNSIHASSQSILEDALFLSTTSGFNRGGIFGASSLDGSKGAPYINLYAVWDEGPSVEAYNLYYDLAFAKATTDTTGITMEELLSQAKVVDTEDGTLAHGKDVPFGNGKMTSFIVKHYAPTDFNNFTTNGTVSVCFQATDSVGNVTEKTILVHIVDTTARDINVGSIRFIDGKYLNQSEENGGFADDSIWKADQQYHDLLASVLDNRKTDIQTAENSFFGKTISIQKPGSGTWKTPPQEKWSFTHEQVLAVHDYIAQNGIGNSKSNTALKGFLNQFAECRQ